MNIAVFSSKPYDRRMLEDARNDVGGTDNLSFTYLEPRLTIETAPLAKDHEAVCIFVHDEASSEVIEQLADCGVKIIVLRCAGFNNVDLQAAEKHGITVARVPAYSPYAVAEHAVGLLLCLNRGFHRAHNRVREGNFSLEGLMGFDVHGKTVGVIGTGKIGERFARLMMGFGCTVVGFDPYPNEDLIRDGVPCIELEELYARSDIISLHCPLTPDTENLIDAEAISSMRDGVFLINTSRGPLLDTPAVIEGLKSGRIGALGLDVYEEEEGIFFEDLSNRIIDDDQLMRLISFHNVLMTSHQAFFTREAVERIASTTLENLAALKDDKPCDNIVKP